MRCKNCKEKFEVKYFNQKYCMKKDECIKVFSDQTKAKEWKARKEKMKTELKTHKDYTKLLQIVFNKYIRQRDGNYCISCGKMSTLQIHAGHYRSVGSAPHLRFNELNVHSQCSQCNNFLSGNLIEYRKNLIKKIGIKEVEKLEEDNTNLKLTIPEIKEQINKYKQLIKK